jgi:RNA polymerase sigma factor (sigma-70 family)
MHMNHGDETCWTLIHAAAAGDRPPRAEFARVYESAMRSYFAARWRPPHLRQRIDDAVQESFLECFRAGGALERADAERAGGFRAFLYGVLRNVALRVEARSARDAADTLQTAINAPTEAHLSEVFDRSWAAALMRQAAEIQRRRAAAEGPEAQRRIELLHLRFHEGLRIREIAKRWQMEPLPLHRQYARARQEFHDALRAAIRFHAPDTTNIDEECERLLASL